MSSHDFSHTCYMLLGRVGSTKVSYGQCHTREDVGDSLKALLVLHY